MAFCILHTGPLHVVIIELLAFSISGVYACKYAVQDFSCPESHWDKNTEDESTRHLVTRKAVEKCHNMNITLLVKPDSRTKTVIVRFEPYPEFATCFELYEVHLNQICGNKFGYRAACFTVILNKETKGAAKFSDIRSGTFQIVVVPCNSVYCAEFDFLSQEFNISDIDDSTKLPLGRKQFPVNTHKESVIILASVGFLLVLISAGFLLAKRYKISSLNKTSHTNIEDGSIEDDDNGVVLNDNQVFIFHSHDEETKRKVGILKDFLQNCAGFNVSSPGDELSEIMNNPNSWVNKVLEYDCSNLGDVCNSSKKIIFVEPENILRCDDIEKSLGDNEIEDDVSRCALSLLFNDWSKCLKDYCHLFVVSFDSSIVHAQGLQNFVSRARYAIPEHTVNLCLNLRYSKNSIYKAKEEMRLLACLNSHPINKLGLECLPDS